MIEAALDTSHGASLAIQVDDLPVVQVSLPQRSRETDRELTPWVRDALLAAGVTLAQIRRWTVGTGPGSFSGVRTGIAFVKGVCAATGALYRGVPSSAALAMAIVAGRHEPVSVGVLNDGRCGQVILSRYLWTGAILEPAGQASAEAPEGLAEAPLACARFVTVQGQAVLPMLPEVVRGQTVCLSTPAARWLLGLPGWDWPGPEAVEASMEPVYVRPAVFVAPHAPRGLAC